MATKKAAMTEKADMAYDKKKGIKEDGPRDKKQDKAMGVKQAPAKKAAKGKRGD